MNTTLDELPDWPKKTALQKIQEELERQMLPLRQIQEMQDLVKRYSPDYQLKELMQQFEPHRQIREMLERSVVPKHIQDFIDSSSVAAQAKRMMEQSFPKDMFANLGLQDDAIRRAAGLDSISSIAKQYEQQLKPFSAHQEMLEKFQRQVFEGLAAVDWARQLGEVSPALRAMEEAKKSLDRLWPTFRDIDFTQVEASENEEQETKQATESICQAATEQESFRKAVEQIVLAIQAQKNPTVQLMLWLFFRKVLDWLIAGAIGAVMGYYAPTALGESPQGDKKAVQEQARVAVGSPELLEDYRYVSAKVLIVRQNPRARSPDVGRLTFGKPVRLLKKEKDFALVLWTDRESGTEIQGWVFARYLAKFN